MSTIELPLGSTPMGEYLASRLEMNEHWHQLIVRKQKTTTMRNWGLLRTAQFEQRARDKKLVRLGQMMKPAIGLIEIVSVQPRFRLWGMTEEDTRREGVDGLTPAEFIKQYSAMLGGVTAVSNKEHTVVKIVFMFVSLLPTVTQVTSSSLCVSPSITLYYYHYWYDTTTVTTTTTTTTNIIGNNVSYFPYQSAHYAAPVCMHKTIR